MKPLLLALFIALGMFPLSSHVNATSSRIDNIVADIREMAPLEIAYEFGTDREFVLQDDQPLLLKCSDNIDGINKILICLTDQFHHSHSIYIICVRKTENNLGAWQIDRVDKTFRAIEKCAVVATWSNEKDEFRLKFNLTDDRQQLTDTFKAFWEMGGYANSGNWQNVIDKNALQLNADERIEIFVKLWTEVKYNFANFDLVPNVNWDQVLADMLPQVRRNQSNEDFAKSLVKCIAALKDGHTDVRMKFFEIFDQAQPALVAKPIAGKAIITRIGTSQDIQKANLSIGDEILQIDGREVGKILEQDIYPYISASTDQWRQHKAFRYLLRGPANSEIQLGIKSIEGEQRDVVLARALDWGRNMPQKEYTDFAYQQLDDNISYVAINTFGTEKVVDKFKEHLDRIRNSKGLIIDVRDNGGGNSGNGDRIVSFLIEQAILNSPWKTPQHIAAFKAWGRPKNWHEGKFGFVMPNDQVERYHGPIVVLIGTKSGSATEDFLVLLHSSQRATLVGSKTSGSTGQPLMFDLGYGVHGRICTKRNTYPDGREFVGVGIIPDIEVQPTVQDIINDRDVVLEKGIEVIKEQIAREK